MSHRLNRPPRLGLEEHRKRRGITLEQIAESTKISRRFLRAIEEGDYELLPGGVFTTSYIRQYAAATGFDAEPILHHCRQTLSPAPAPAPERRPDSPAPAMPRWASRFFSIG